MKFTYLILIFIVLVCGCAKPPQTTGSLGYEDSRRIIIVGENADPNVAGYYQKKYEALVWFTPFEGRFVNKANNFFQSGLGPSVAMRSLMNELKSINYSVGQWEIFVPGMAESYVLNTFKNMEDHSLSKARGVVILLDSKSNRDIEDQVKRLADGNFFVRYELENKTRLEGLEPSTPSSED